MKRYYNFLKGFSYGASGVFEPHAAGSRGVSILVALMVVMTIMMLATISLKTSSDEIDISSHELDALQAYNAAESGLSYASSALNENGDFTGTINDTFEVRLEEDDSTPETKYAYYKAEVIDKNGDGRADVILSTGYYNGKKRAVMAKVLSIKPFVIEKPRKVRVN
ncbi:MAG TPA: hypothetical protein PK467_06645 [Candidatus Wallbacteria bacterium]|nr:hypothetical protein [Candidatus Wallbacteria bacterium]